MYFVSYPFQRSSVFRKDGKQAYTCNYVPELAGEYRVMDIRLSINRICGKICTLFVLRILTVPPYYSS